MAGDLRFWTHASSGNPWVNEGGHMYIGVSLLGLILLVVLLVIIF